MKSFILMVILSVTLSGCFWDAKIDDAAMEAKVVFVGAIEPSKNSEKLLEREFLASDVPWNEERVTKINQARITIKGNTEYVKERLNFDSSLPYYTYKSWFEIMSNQYMKLQIELDARVKIPGAISDLGYELYWYAKRDINMMLEAQRLKIAATEKSIEDKASADTIEDMKRIYATIKPLVGLVM